MAAERCRNRLNSAILAVLVAGYMLAGTVVAVTQAAAQTAMDQGARLELEQLLHELGFAPGAIDGVIDEDTRAAIGLYHDFAFIAGEAPEATPTLLTELRGVVGQVRELRETTGAKAPAEPDLADYGTLEPEEVPEEVPEAEAVPETGPDTEAVVEETEAPAPLQTAAGDGDAQSLPPVEPSAPEAPPAQTAALPPPEPEAALETEPVAGSGPEPGQAFLQEGVAALEAGQADRAIALLTAALGLQPGLIDAYEFRAAALVAKGDLESALGDFDQVVRLAPEAPSAYNNRCWVLGLTGRYAEALRDCDFALGLRPDFAAAFHSRAQVQEKMGQDDGARADYARAYALAPENPEIALDAGRLGLAD